MMTFKNSESRWGKWSILIEVIEWGSRRTGGRSQKGHLDDSECGSFPGNKVPGGNMEVWNWDKMAAKIALWKGQERQFTERLLKPLQMLVGLVGTEGKEVNQKLRLNQIPIKPSSRVKQPHERLPLSSSWMLHGRNVDSALPEFMFFSRQARHLDPFYVNFANYKCWRLF